MIKNCLKCNKEFYTKPSRIKDGRGKYCSRECTSHTLFTREKTLGDKNHNWKNEGYSTEALHMWVNRQLGKPIRCQFCLSNKNLQWANRSQLYKRDVEDWLELCSKCHKYYDNEMHKILGIKSFRRRRFING